MMNEDNISAEERNKIFRSLRKLMGQNEGLNKEEMTILLIGAAISNGFDRGKRITGALVTLGMNKQYAGIILKQFTGLAWQRHEDGRYGLIG
jgi:hypothetical protein